MDTRMLIEQAKQGNQEAFGQLYANTYNKNYYSILKMFGNDDVTVNVLQDAYARIYAMLPEFVYYDDAGFEAWTGIVAANTALEMIRKNNPWAFVDNPEDMEVVQFNERELKPQVVEKLPVSDGTASEMIQTVLASLTEEQRVCTMMYYVNQLPVTEIATSLGCSERLVQKHLSYAKSQIAYITEQNQNPEIRGVALPGLQLFVSLLARDLSSMSWSGVAARAYGAVYGAAIANSVKYVGQSVGAVGSGNAAYGTAGGVANGQGIGASGAMNGQTVGAVGTGSSAAQSAGFAAGKGVAVKAGASLGAKIAVGIASTALVVGGGLGIAKYVDSQKDKKDTSTAQPGITTESTMEATSSDAQNVAEATTEEEKQADLRYMNAYANILKEHRYEIQSYICQYGIDYSGYSQKAAKEPTPVAITDITGDDIPELIYIEAHGESAQYSGNLHIWTMDENGEAKEIYYSEYFDAQVAGGTGYMLFKEEGENTLYGFDSMSDESTEMYFYRLSMDGSGNLVKDSSFLSKTEGPDENYTTTIVNCTHDGVTIALDEYERLKNELLNSASDLIMYNSNYKSEDMAESIKSHATIQYLSYGQALRKLGVIEPTEENPMPFTDIQSFFFSSGAGGWGTVVTVNPDGTFEGDYHDSDMGDTGEGYSNGTVYVCTFKGKFKDIKKINDNTYSMTLDYCNIDETPGDTWIENEVLYVSAGPYGIDGGETFYLYLPGTAVSELPEEYVNWCWLSDTETLPYFGLYNVDMQEGFSGQ